MRTFRDTCIYTEVLPRFSWHTFAVIRGVVSYSACIVPLISRKDLICKWYLYMCDFVTSAAEYHYLCSVCQSLCRGLTICTRRNCSNIWRESGFQRLFISSELVKWSFLPGPCQVRLVTYDFPRVETYWTMKRVTLAAILFLPHFLGLPELRLAHHIPHQSKKLLNLNNKVANCEYLFS